MFKNTNYNKKKNIIFYNKFIKNLKTKLKFI